MTNNNIHISDEVAAQLQNCTRLTKHCALMANHHLGYVAPYGTVLAYEGMISPSIVGHDIACGHAIILLDADAKAVQKRIKPIMDKIFRFLSFGVNRVGKRVPDHDLFYDDPAWDIPEIAELKDLARSQFGTIGTNDHYVNLFLDEQDRVWCGVHFGSRGLGYKIASHYITEGGGRHLVDVDPVVFDSDSDLGRRYIAAMHLAGRYAYAGRDWVCTEIARMLKSKIIDKIHNNHNFAWKEVINSKMHWVVRKGSIQLKRGKRGFISGSMADNSVVVEGIADSMFSSAPHSAGRIIPSNMAAGRSKWVNGKLSKLSNGVITHDMMMELTLKAGVELRGGAPDKSTHCYKRLSDVLEPHKTTMKVLHTLRPIGVAMANEDEYDPYRN